MNMRYNPSIQPILSGKGAVLLNGERRDEFVSFVLNAAIQEYKWRVLYQRGYTTRPKAIDFTGTLVCYKTSLWLFDYVREYKQSGVVPDITLQLVQADPSSKFYEDHPRGQMVTIPHIQLTGDIPIIQSDVEGDGVQESITFTAQDIM